MSASAWRHLFAETARTDRGVTYADGRTETFDNYAELASDAGKLAERWLEWGLRDRFVAVIWMEQSLSYLRALMSVLLAGGIPVPLHPYAKWPEADKAAQLVEAELVIVSAGKANQLPAELSGSHLFADGETAEPLTVHRVPSVFRRSYTPPEAASILFLSSGSTGTPKGVMLSADNVLSNVRSIQHYVRLDDGDRVLLAKSLGYCSTFTGEWLLALTAGAHLQLAPGFMHPFEAVRFVRQFGTTFMCTVPSFMLPLVKSDRWRPVDLQSLRQLLVVGGGMAPDMLLDLKRKLPWTAIMPSYGLTEASPRVSYLPSEQLERRPGSVGLPVKDVEIAICRDGKPVPRGEPGEIVIRGPNVMLGYYADERRSASVLTSYGLCTADVGWQDEEGYLYVTGRLDSAVNVGGHTIYPETVEQTLLTHPSVMEAGVAGCPDPVWGERLVAFAVAGTPPEDEHRSVCELMEHCRDRLSAALCPRDIRFVESLPKTKNGKLDRQALRSMAKEWEHVQHGN